MTASSLGDVLPADSNALVDSDNIEDEYVADRRESDETELHHFIRQPVDASAGEDEPPTDSAQASAIPLLPIISMSALTARLDIRTVCLTVLTILAVLFALQMARPFLVPLVISVILAYALDPAVSFLQRRGAPRVFGSTLVIALIVIALYFCFEALRGQIVGIIDQLPDIATKMSKLLGTTVHGDESMLDKLQRAALVLEKSSQTSSPGTRVLIERPGSGFNALLLAGSANVLSFLGQGVMVGFLVFFLLISGDKFRRKFVKLTAHTAIEKKISLHMLDAINRSIRLYMVMLLVTNLVLAVFTWAAFRWIGLDNAGTWAVAAGALHVIPYFGPVIIAASTGVAAFLQFGDVSQAVLTAASSLLIATIIGTVVTTWMAGRIAKMNNVAVFIALLLFTWLWGIWGTLLSIPIVVIVKVVADHVTDMEALAEFLGD